MDNINALSISENLAARTLYQIAGAYFRLVSASSSATVTVELLRGGRVIGSLSGFLAGLAIEGTDFDAVALTPSVASDIEFVIANAAVKYDRLAGAVTIGNTAGAYTRAAIAAQDAITAGELFAANTARRVLFVQNNSGADYLRLRVDGVATTSAGVRIAPGDYWEPPAGFAPTGAVSVMAESGTVAIEGLEG